MIPCTEFVPAYNELFAFLDLEAGYEDGVKKFWDFLFSPDRYVFLEEKVSAAGLRGCWDYWSKSLNEEAADFTMYLNEKDGWFLFSIHHCPSKGRLLELKQITPYCKYCDHCTSYRKVLEKHGLCNIYSFLGVDSASCESLVYDPRRFKNEIRITPDTLVMDRRAGDNTYYHRDFHWCMNASLNYLGQTYGEDRVTDYLSLFAKEYYAPVISDIGKKGLEPLADMIQTAYSAEKADDALKMERHENSLHVWIAYCPAVRYLHSIGEAVSPWFRYTTETVMGEIAAEAGLQFNMLLYEPETGRAEYRFERTV